MHFGVNAVWLLAFGSAVARRFGAMRFLAFFAVTAAAGAAMHLLTNSGSQAPMIGASASISGAMAAAMRFAFQRGGPLGALRGGDDDAFRPRLAIDHRRQRGRCLASPYRRLSRRVVAVFLVRSQADAAAIHQRWPDIALG
jgi:membrane associated rhomboid family serine protease